tara:strand:+ start:3531 stop:4007 length:477 start_codon:yes stop_codon:yes gene_type:complete
MTAIQTNNETDQQTLEGDYENPWTYKGTTFTSSDINGFFGYVYCITNLTTGRKYIGRKYFTSSRKPRGGKRKVTSESDWKRYYGSSKQLTDDVKKLGRSIFRREILSLHRTKGWVNYEETRQLFLNNVLSEDENFYNSNILGRYMKKDYFNEQRTTDT